MADKVSKSQKWLIQGQVEYFTPFTMLWIALLNYCREHPEFQQGRDSDKAIIDFLKQDQSFRDAFTRRLLYGLDDERKIFGLIAKELKRVDLLNFRGTRIDFNDLESTEDENGDKVGIQCGDFVFVYADEDIYLRFLDFVYQMRCNFIHGNLYPDHSSHAKLAKCTHALLDVALKEVINIE